MNKRQEETLTEILKAIHENTTTNAVRLQSLQEAVEATKKEPKGGKVVQELQNIRSELQELDAILENLHDESNMVLGDAGRELLNKAEAQVYYIERLVDALKIKLS